jgi:hypothetical protein
MHEAHSTIHASSLVVVLEARCTILLVSWPCLKPAEQIRLSSGPAGSLQYNLHVLWPCLKLAVQFACLVVLLEACSTFPMCARMPEAW